MDWFLTCWMRLTNILWEPIILGKCRENDGLIGWLNGWFPKIGWKSVENDIWGWFNDIMVISLIISWGFLMQIDNGCESMSKNNGYTPIWDVFFNDTLFMVNGMVSGIRLTTLLKFVGEYNELNSDNLLWWTWEIDERSRSIDEVPIDNGDVPVPKLLNNQSGFHIYIYMYIYTLYLHTLSLYIYSTVCSKFSADPGVVRQNMFPSMCPR